MMSSKLPTASLGKIWDLSDIDRDGLLDRYEFTVAMHLVFRALQVISKFNLPTPHFLVYKQKLELHKHTNVLYIVGR